MVRIKLPAISNPEVQPGLATFGDHGTAIDAACQIHPCAAGVQLPVTVDAQCGINIQTKGLGHANTGGAAQANHGVKGDQPQRHLHRSWQTGRCILLHHVFQLGGVGVCRVRFAVQGIGHQADKHRQRFARA